MSRWGESNLLAGFHSVVQHAGEDSLVEIGRAALWGPCRLALCGAVRVDGGADDPHLVRGRHDFEAAALQGTHLDHFMHEPIQ